MTMRTIPTVLAALVMGATMTASAAGAEVPTLPNLDRNGVILDGYDPVAFFTDGKPIPGVAEFQSTYRGATYRFASAEHKAVFDEDPAKYEPQFGAWCAYAVSQGRTAPIDVSTFSIVDGRLVLQHNAKAVRLWNENVAAHLEDADLLWPAVVANGGKQIDAKKVLGRDPR